MDLGKKIRAHRDELGLTQAELADKLGLTYSSVSQWESGRATPRTPILRQLADLFNTTVADLMGEDAAEAAISGTSRMVPLLGFAHMGEPGVVGRAHSCVIGHLRDRARYDRAAAVSPAGRGRRRPPAADRAG